MKNMFKDRRGASDKIENAINLVLLLIVIGALAPVTLVSLFNTTAFTGVPVWVVTTLGIFGAIAFIYLMWRAARGGK